MITLLLYGIFGGVVGLVLYELIEEIHDGAHRLQDRYHE